MIVKEFKYILDRKNSIPEKDLLKWAEWLGKANRQIAKTKIDNIIISDVFIGLDQGFLFDERPIRTAPIRVLDVRFLTLPVAVH